MSATGIDMTEFRRLRRDLRRAEPAAARALDGEFRQLGNEIAVRARGLSPRKSGRLASGWRPSVTSRRGVAIRNAQPHAGVNEYGGRVWLREGTEYEDDSPGPLPERGRGIERRQVHLPDGRFVNEARYLIKASRAGHRAAAEGAEVAVPRIEEAMTRAVDRSLS